MQGSITLLSTTSFDGDKGHDVSPLASSDFSPRKTWSLLLANSTEGLESLFARPVPARRWESTIRFYPTMQHSWTFWFANLEGNVTSGDGVGLLEHGILIGSRESSCGCRGDISL
jgi:hypothetical protein